MLSTCCPSIIDVVYDIVLHHICECGEANHFYGKTAVELHSCFIPSIQTWNDAIGILPVVDLVCDQTDHWEDISLHGVTEQKQLWSLFFREQVHKQGNSHRNERSEVSSSGGTVVFSSALFPHRLVYRNLLRTKPQERSL